MKRLVLLWCFITTSAFASTLNQWQGVPFPEFSLLDQHGEVRTNKDYTGRWLIVYFYPKDKTPGCTVEAQNFTDDYQLFKSLNTEILGVSYDDVDSHKEFADLYNMPFSLLADTEATLSKKLKVDRLLPWPHASRQTFLVDPSGKIVHHFAEVTPKKHSKELLQLIKKLNQSTKKSQDS
ncbi:peroxiredoxin [Aliikangiella maris]|uniref:Peroxiredoxin n=2 Tax=Aliikangiella maris TaxID=3162458 RepID=A0ABV2BV52_9GAMM